MDVGSGPGRHDLCRGLRLPAARERRIAARRARPSSRGAVCTGRVAAAADRGWLQASDRPLRSLRARTRKLRVVRGDAAKRLTEDARLPCHARRLISDSHSRRSPIRLSFAIAVAAVTMSTAVAMAQQERAKLDLAAHMPVTIQLHNA